MVLLLKFYFLWNDKDQPEIEKFHSEIKISTKRSWKRSGWKWVKFHENFWRQKFLQNTKIVIFFNQILHFYTTWCFLHQFWFKNVINIRIPHLIPCILPPYWPILRYKNSKNEEIWEIQEDQRRYMFIFWLLFRLVGISSISETGLFYVWIRSNILKRILHQIGQTSSFLIIDTVDPMKDNTTVHRGLHIVVCITYGFDQNDRSKP